MSSVAVYHLSIKTIGRTQGRSAVAAAAYRTGARLFDARLGRIFDYRRRSGVLHSQIVVPMTVPSWARVRESLWNEVEKSETRKNSTTAREFEIALPNELSEPERQKLALTLASELADRHQCAVDIAIHAPARGGDNRNHHAHILCSTRRIGPTGFNQKVRELDDQKSGEVQHWRARWATLVNEALSSAQVSDRVDHRSLEAQGVARVPTVHAGPSRTAMARRLLRRTATEKAKELSPMQERLANQLSNMHSRLSKSNFKRFESSLLTSPKTEKGDQQNEPPSPL